MDELGRAGLTAAQFALITHWLPGPSLVDDLSWGIDTTVLRVRAAGRDYVVKAGGPANHHIGREISAFELYGAALADRSLGSRLVAADRGANLLVLEFLQGRLVEGSENELTAEVHEQAGRVLAVLHAQDARLDNEAEARDDARALARLDGQHRIEPGAARQARAILVANPDRAVITVPTHGDWQPRNWLINGGAVNAIDFGRFDFRHPATDLCRLAVQQWRSEPSLEAAFIAGYGRDPRDPELWRIQLLREAVATAVWAFQVGLNEFEAQGHVMLDDALARF